SASPSSAATTARGPGVGRFVASATNDRSTASTIAAARDAKLFTTSIVVIIMLADSAKWRWGSSCTTLLDDAGSVAVQPEGRIPTLHRGSATWPDKVAS
ncbi:MAG: hypothetical protein KBG15_24675, partial [Kofleriaceae bacterium]|nr:hypothetical protein [Kofleriaceae bacterium]